MDITSTAHVGDEHEVEECMAVHCELDPPFLHARNPSMPRGGGLEQDMNE
jgi:hypothetical protein